MTWEKFERLVRTTASFIWCAPADPALINGVKCDCVLKVKPNYWVLIEITQDESLSKLRTDLAKFATVRPHLHSQDIYAECFFVCEQDPPPSLIESGKGHKTEVLSLAMLRKKFFDYPRYCHIRSHKAFGSAVDPFSGKKDERAYVPVTYYATEKHNQYTVSELARLLQQKKHVILLGNYGSGKSRCVQEVFSCLATDNADGVVALAINLRENWGVSRAHEIIRRHFDDLGRSEDADSLVRVLDVADVCFLLDGFDEVGSQTWSDNPAVLKDIRAKSLAGVKDLISKANGGVLVTGRDHYFNSDREMFTCLGLNPNDTIVLRCPEQFTDQQMSQYLKEIHADVSLPKWLPKRPLICQIISTLEKNVVATILAEESGELEFWDTFITAICHREAKINPVLDPDTIRKVLLRVARCTRAKKLDTGPISMRELNQAFESVLGVPAVDESAVMLQRLATLGRIGPESTDRQFVDTYILDGLRAEDTMMIVDECDVNSQFQGWCNGLKPFGLRLVARAASLDPETYTSRLKEAAKHGYSVLAADLLASLCLSELEDVDAGGASISCAHVSLLNFSQRRISNISIEFSMISELDIADVVATDVRITQCEIGRVFGITAAEAVPEWLRGNMIGAFQSLATVKRIKGAQLTVSQRVFVTVIKKTFFQPGSGRKEAALLRGLGEAADKKAAKRILNLLMDESILTRNKGDEGWVYHPVRKYTRRMREILNRLTLNTDPLWLALER